ncbi:unnamed protein product [Orchesella dallaii]|uniref:Odorant receptor n=1 Tax=Orchesella dallaii TaxID=48710 RepID=A0ABP1SAY0_9HEXA
MANKLTISALRLHDKISSYYAPPHIIHWDRKSTAGGKYCAHPQKSIILLPWYLSNAIVFGGIFVCEGNFLTLLLTPYKGGVPIVPIVFSFSVGFLGLFAFGVNMVFFYNADEYIESLNCLIRYGNEIANTIPKTKRINRSNKLTGMLALWMVIFANIFPFLVVPLQWLEGFDPTKWILKIILGDNFEEVLWPAFRIMLLVIRLGLSIAYLTEIYRTICIMCLIMILEPPLFSLCLQEFNRETLDYPVLAKYLKLCRIRNINVNSCGQITGISMASCFVMTTYVHVACLFYWDKLSGPILGCLVGGTISMDCVLYTVLPWVTKLYDMSSGLISKWRKQNAGMKWRRLKKRHLGMLLKGTRSISFKVGNIGTLKQETELCYFQSILDAFCDLALTLNGTNLL